jgi:hypothetical protein
MIGTLVIAYIDPGTAGIVIQMILAGVVGVGVYFRRTIVGLWWMLTGKKSTGKSPETKHE